MRTQVVLKLEFFPDGKEGFLGTASILNQEEGVLFEKPVILPENVRNILNFGFLPVFLIRLLNESLGGEYFITTEITGMFHSLFITEEENSQTFYFLLAPSS